MRFLIAMMRACHTTVLAAVALHCHRSVDVSSVVCRIAPTGGAVLSMCSDTVVVFQEDEEEGGEGTEEAEEKKDPTHYLEMDPKTMKVVTALVYDVYFNGFCLA